MNTAIETLSFNGIEAIRLCGPSGNSAVISRLGGQVLSWITSDGRERLYLSEKAVYDGSRAIRGGVPVCFPQFSGLGSLPKHGLLRTLPWTVTSTRHGEDYALATLEITEQPATLALWPHAFRAEITVMLEKDRLDIEFSVENTGDAPFDFTAALHTYLRVTQVEDVALEGLYGHEYRDAANGDRIVRDSGTEIVVEGPTDRVYHDVRRPQLLRAGNLSLGLQSRGFADVVVWNPWIDGMAGLPDMPADDWRHMLCIEPAAARVPVSLPAGEEWSGRQSFVAV